MQEADYGMTESAMTQNRYAGDGALLVRFFMHPMQMRKESEDQGRPIFRDTEYIRIITPGNKDNIVERPASQMDKDRFPEHYRKFRAREEQQTEGTPLDDWGGCTRSQAAELKFLNVMTVEQLASMSDSNAQNIMGASILREKAIKYLDSAKDEVDRQQMQDLQDQNKALMARLEALEARQGATERVNAPAIEATEPDVEPEAAPKPKRRRRTTKE